MYVCVCVSIKLEHALNGEIGIFSCNPHILASTSYFKLSDCVRDDGKSGK